MNELIELFKNINIPIVYKNSKRNGLNVPYGIYFRSDEKSIFSDNKRHFKNVFLKLELYFNDLKSQLDIENQIEELLENNGYLYVKELDIEIDDSISMVVYKIGGLRTCQK